MLKKIILVVALAVAGVLGLAATKPDEFRFERKTEIKAPPEKVFAILNDFKRWGEWSPWEKKDPAMKRTFGAITSGKGATYAWEGNKDVGQGGMEIVESVPSSKIAINLNFLKPFEAQNKVEFTLAASGDKTTVNWVMQGKCNFISKIIQVFVSMDRMVGPDFEAGLASLKAVAEKP